MFQRFHILAQGKACFTLYLCLAATCLGCSEPGGRTLNLQDYGAKITARDNGVAIDIRNAPDFDDDAIELLKPHAKDLVDLTMQKVQITDSGILKLEPFTEVGRLILNDTPVTGKALAHLSQLPLKDNLWNVGLKNTAITDNDLKLLADLPNLTRIDLTGTEISDEGLANLAGKNWRMINVKETAVTDSGVQKLKEMFPMTDVVH